MALQTPFSPVLVANEDYLGYLLGSEWLFIYVTNNLLMIKSIILKSCLNGLLHVSLIYFLGFFVKTEPYLFVLIILPLFYIFLEFNLYKFSKRLKNGVWTILFINTTSVFITIILALPVFFLFKF